jgi:hypothetical protein
MTNRRISSVAISQAIRDAPELLSISLTTVYTILAILSFYSLSPITAFPLNIAHRAVRVAFATQRSRDDTDWNKALFTDECSFVLGDRQWVW